MQQNGIVIFRGRRSESKNNSMTSCSQPSTAVGSKNSSSDHIARTQRAARAAKAGPAASVANESACSESSTGMSIGNSRSKRESFAIQVRAS